jgi:hypothetical protein
MVKKLAVIATMFLAGQIVCGAFALWGLYELSLRAEKIYQKNLIPIAQLGDMRLLNYRMIALNGAHIQAYDSGAIKRAEEDIAAGDKQMDELIPQSVRSASSIQSFIKKPGAKVVPKAPVGIAAQNG